MDMNVVSIQLFITGLSFLAVSALLFIARQTVKRLPIHADQKRRAIKTSSYAAVLIFMILLVVIWADELRDAALVLSAFAVAIVLSTKELIMCVTGWWLKLAGGHFRIGDRIQIGDFNGDVVDYGLLTISLLEIDAKSPRQQRSGSILTVPNSMLLTHAVINQTLAFSFRWHSVHLTIPKELDWKVAETALREAGEEMWETYEKKAELEVEKFSDRFTFTAGNREPTVFLGHGSDGRVTLELRVGLPVLEGHHVEDQILRSYYSKLSVH